MFNRPSVPKEISAVKLTKWYSSLDEKDVIKLGRYIGNADTSSETTFFISVMELSAKDENFKFSAFIGDSGKKMKMNDMERFLFNEKLIESYMGAERYEDAKATCRESLTIYPKISEKFLKDNNGVLPEKLNCRNNLIDVMVGIDVDYDGAFKMLDHFFELKLIDKETYDLRVQSLKIHRMQRVFDGVYTYRPK